MAHETGPQPFAPVMALSHIVIRARDLDASADFYARVLGFRIYRDKRAEPIGDRSEAILGTLGDIAIEFVQSPVEAAARAVRRGRDEPGYSHIALTVSDVAGALAQLKSAGLTRFPEIVTTPAGHKVMMFRDPDGNVIELIELADARSLYEIATR